MSLAALKAWLVPLLTIVLINGLIALWRALPETGMGKQTENGWPELQLPPVVPDVRDKLLAGGQWGQPDTDSNESADSNFVEDAELQEAAQVQAYIEKKLLGIVFRDGWRLLFARSDAAALPYELVEGQQLPNSPWKVEQIWADRIELRQSDADADVEPLMIYLHPITLDAIEHKLE